MSVPASVTTVTKVNASGVPQDHKSKGLALPTGKPMDIKAVGSANSAGTSKALARADHVHEGVHSTDYGTGPLTGDIQVVAGTGINITVAGNQATIEGTATDPKIWLMARNNAPQSIPANTFTEVKFPNLDSLSGISDFVINGASTQFAPQTGGVYRTVVQVTFDGVDGGSREVRIQRFDSLTTLSEIRASSTKETAVVTAGKTSINLTADVPIGEIGDYIFVEAWQSSAGNLSIGTSPYVSLISMDRIHS